jgi:hypothetical protein
MTSYNLFLAKAFFLASNGGYLKEKRDAARQSVQSKQNQESCATTIDSKVDILVA